MLGSYQPLLRPLVQALSIPTLSLNKQLISMVVSAAMHSTTADANDVLLSIREVVISSMAQVGWSGAEEG